MVEGLHGLHNSTDRSLMSSKNDVIARIDSARDTLIEALHAMSFPHDFDAALAHATIAVAHLSKLADVDATNKRIEKAVDQIKRNQ